MTADATRQMEPVATQPSAGHNRSTRHRHPRHDESIEIALNGGLGTLAGRYPRQARRGIPSGYAGAAQAIDPYEIVLTQRRLVALRPRIRGGASSIALECDRQEALAVLDRRGLIFDRLQLGCCTRRVTVRGVLRNPAAAERVYARR